MLVVVSRGWFAYAEQAVCGQCSGLLEDRKGNGSHLSFCPRNSVRVEAVGVKAVGRRHDMEKQHVHLDWKVELGFALINR